MSMAPYLVRLCPRDALTFDADLMFMSRPHLGETVVHEGTRYTITEIDWEPSGVETIGNRPIWGEFIVAREDTKPGLGREKLGR